MTATTIHASAADAITLYQEILGRHLAETETATLAELLAMGSDGRWANPRPAPFPRADAVLEARALYGLLVLGEQILWSFQTAQVADGMFRRIRGFMPGTAVEQFVSRSSATALRIDTRHGGSLMFAGRYRGNRALRGLSVDCHLVEQYEGRDAELILPTRSRPNSQLILSW